MAVASTVVWEVRSTGNANNGGGFKTGASGSDFSQQDSAQYNLTSATSSGAGAVILHASAAADMVGNIARVVSGTNFTAGWYEITSVSAGVSITVDRNCTTGAGASGVVNIGGALINLNTWSADTNVVVPGQVIWMKGSPTSSSSVTMATGSSAGIRLEGYNSTRGDTPMGSNRPTYAMTGSGDLTFGQCYTVRNIIFTGSTTNVVTGSANATGSVYNCKFVNTSTTADRQAFNGGGSVIFSCEGVSYKGVAFAVSGAKVFGCYAHDSKIGFDNGTGAGNYSNTVIEGCTRGISWTSSSNSSHLVVNCTIVGTSAQYGDGLYFQPSGGVAPVLAYNNIIAYCTTGINSTAPHVVNDYNDVYSNGTNYSGSTGGAHNITTNPTFTDFAGLSGSTATTSGSVLTQSGGDFSTVQDNVDCLILVSGTGITAGIYLITSHTSTTVTLDAAPGTNATADKVWRINTGHDLKIGTNMKGQGVPSAFPGGNFTDYIDLGGVQSQGGTSSDPGEANVRNGTAYVINDVNKTGTCYVPTAANVRHGVNVDATTGLAYIPTAANTRFGINVDQTTGLAHIPDPEDVRIGVDVDQTVGLLNLPVEADVLDGISYDNGTKTGTLLMPTVQEIVDGINASPKTLTVPKFLGLK